MPLSHPTTFECLILFFIYFFFRFLSSHRTFFSSFKFFKTNKILLSHSYIPKEKSFCPKARLFVCNVSSTTSSIAIKSLTKLDRSILHFFFLFQILQLQMNDYRYHYMFTTFVSTSSNYFQQSFETIKKKILRNHSDYFGQIVGFLLKLFDSFLTSVERRVVEC